MSVNANCTRCNLRPFVYGSEKDGMCEMCFEIRKAESRVSNTTSTPTVAQRLQQNVKLNTRQKAVLQKRAPKPPQIIEENWGGLCKGGCGKYISGEFVCYDCRKAAAEKNFTLTSGEVELYRGNVGNPEDKIIKQVVAVKGTSVKAEPMTWMWKERLPDGAITWIVGQPGNAKSSGFGMWWSLVASGGRRQCLFWGNGNRSRKVLFSSVGIPGDIEKQ